MDRQISKNEAGEDRYSRGRSPRLHDDLIDRLPKRGRPVIGRRRQSILQLDQHVRMLKAQPRSARPQAGIDAAYS